MKILDRYILSRFVRNFFYLAISFLLIFVLVDLVENVDRFIDKGGAPFDIAIYYLYYLPWIFVIVSPIGLLLSANFTGSSFAKSYEVIAGKSSGISALRMGIPVYIFGFLWSFVILGFGEFVVPFSSEMRTEIKDVKLLKKKEHTKINQDIFLMGEDGQTYSVRSYNPKTMTGSEVSIVYFDDDLHLKKRMDARNMLWKDDGWELRDVYVRDFTEEGEVYSHHNRLEIESSEKPADFEEKKVDPDQMGFFRLKRYIEKAIRMGRNASREQTELYVKLTFPFANFLILLFSFPLALHMRRSGAALGFGISFVVSFTYFILFKVGQSLGYNESLPPLIAANIGNFVYGFIGVFALWKFRD